MTAMININGELQIRKDGRTVATINLDSHMRSDELNTRSVRKAIAADPATSRASTTGTCRKPRRPLAKLSASRCTPSARPVGATSTELLSPAVRYRRRSFRAASGRVDAGAWLMRLAAAL